MRKQDLVKNFPLLARQWHPTKNEELQPNTFGSGSDKSVWWICDLGHDWKTSLRERTKNNRGCPYCSGKKAWAGYNDLETLNPDLAAQWHPTLNKNISPRDVIVGSHAKIWWLCKLNHHWEAAVKTRNAGSNCPYCSGNKVWIGFNDFQTIAPNIALEWYPAKNNSLNPTDFTSGSNQIVSWICIKGHDWETSIKHRVISKSGCPVCAGFKVWEGYNDLLSKRPLIAAQWHPELNGNLLPSQVTAWSQQKVHWLCEKKHSWSASPGSRDETKNGCPYCTNKKVLLEFNDLATTHPELLLEWDYIKNTIDPKAIVAGYQKRVHWICSKKHEWQVTPSTRTLKNSGCSICATSRTERVFAKKIQEKLNDTFSSQKVFLTELNKKVQLDICGTYNDMKIAIEYDGSHWHGNRDSFIKDKNITAALISEGYFVVRIREQGKHKLAELNMKNTNLLQVKYQYTADAVDSDKICDQIVSWIEKKQLVSK